MNTFKNVVKTSECFSHVPLTEKGHYIQFYKGPGGTDPTERKIFVGSCTEPGTSQLPLNQCEWGLIKAVGGQMWVCVCFFSSCFAKKATGERTVLISHPCFLSCNGRYDCPFFFNRELRLWNQSKNKSRTKKFLKKAKINQPWKNNKRGMWITQHFPWFVYLSHTITIKWLTCLYPLQKGFFAFSRDSALQPTNQPHSFTTLS